MTVGILNISLSMRNSFNLKDKRRILNGIKDSLRNRFNISIAVVDDNEKYNYARLGIACVSPNVHFTREVLSRVLNNIEDRWDVEVVNIERSIL
ncbi:MAG: DUF503 domain-containing protein [Deltaproteobacteria bacterium]|nr:DUF503 domain-containing protein [Deltaproteobacteria bacterium]